MIRKMRLRWIIGILLANICAVPFQGQYHVIPGKTNPASSAECLPETPARICQGTTEVDHCYAPPSDKDIIFGLEPRATPVGQLDGIELTLFTAMYSSCGSGTLTKYSLLMVRGGELVNLLPSVELSNQSDYKFWNLPEFSSLPVLVTADFIWDYTTIKKSNYIEETHSAPHRYRMNAYVYDTKSGRYLQKVRFDTTKMYSGQQDAEEINIVDAEKAVIMAKLRQNRTY
ncbi:MAG: hypothetical protein ABR990_01615 [Terracidiphilus sp.]